MAAVENFAAVPRLGTVEITTTNTTISGNSGDFYEVFAAGAKGSLVDEISVKATTTTAAGVIRCFLNDGTNRFLYAELLVTVVSPSTTAAAWGGVINLRDEQDNPLRLPEGWSIDVTSTVDDAMHCTCKGADF